MRKNLDNESRQMVRNYRRRAIIMISNTLWYLFTFRRRTIHDLQKDGWHVICIGKIDECASKLEADGCLVLPLDWEIGSMRPLHELGIVLRIIITLLAVRPTAVFSFTIKANLNTSIACRLCGVPYVTNVSGLGTAFLRDGLLYRFVRRLFGFANAGAHTVFFQNSTDRNHFRNIGLSVGRRTHVLPGSGVDTNHFQFVTPRERITTFIMIARLIRDKGVSEYLEAARLLKTRQPGLRFLLAGPAGIENASAMTVDEINSYRDAVTYFGEIQDVRNVLREADCIVLPSYREGMPKVILEGASMGRIAVVTDVPGCRDAIIHEQTGFLCQARSVNDLARNLQRATELDAKTLAVMSNAARQRAIDVFSEPQCIEPYFEALKTIQDDSVAIAG